MSLLFRDVTETTIKVANVSNVPHASRILLGAGPVCMVCSEIVSRMKLSQSQVFGFMFTRNVAQLISRGLLRWSESRIRPECCPVSGSHGVKPFPSTIQSCSLSFMNLWNTTGGVLRPLFLFPKS